MVYRVRHLYPMNRFLLFCHNKRPSYDLDFIIEEPLMTYLQKKFHIAHIPFLLRLSQIMEPEPEPHPHPPRICPETNCGFRML